MNKNEKYKSSDIGQCTTVERWTNLAIDCYKRGCVCKGCFYENFFSKPRYGEDYKQKCQMKAAVLELVRVLGVPNERNNFN